MNYLQKKKLAFMSVVNSVKGFVRTVSGVPPLKLYYCVDTKSMIDYSITGNGVGDYDEETGKYKIPVKCSSINLFNPEEVIAKFESGDTYMNGAYTCTKIQLKPNTKYYLKTFKPKYSGYFYLSNSNGVSSSLAGTIGVNNDAANAYPRGYEKSVTTDSTGCLYIGHYLSSANDRDKILRENQIQIVEGSYTAITAPDYEPYVEPITTNIYLDEPLEGTINYKNDKLPFLPTVKGTTIYSAETQVQPSNMEVVYYSTSKE